MTNTDRPKLLGDEEAVKLRLSQLGEAHIAPLTCFVDSLRHRMGEDAAIPYFDPWDGGIEAEILLLLEAPGPKATNSGFVSMNNPDETAKNLYEIFQEVGIPRKRSITWNTIPWYIGSGSKIRPANAGDITAGVESLGELFSLLTKLRAVVLVGAKAQKTKRYVSEIAPHLEILESPHPSPMFVNRKPENRGVLVNSFRAVQNFLAG